MTLAGIFTIYQNVVEVYKNENIKLFYQNFVDIALKARRGVEKPKKLTYYLKLLYYI